jgi:predicted nucleotidyltransferase
MVALSRTQQEELESIRQRHGLRLIVAFGSRVKGRMHDGSDLDLGVLAEAYPESPGRMLANLAPDLDAVFPGITVDVAVLNGADPLLLGEVSDACQLLAGAASDLQEFRMYAFKVRQDHQQWLELEALVNERRLAAL